MESKGRGKFLLLLTGFMLSPLAGASTGSSNQLIRVEDLPTAQRSIVYLQVLNHLKNTGESISQDSTIVVDQEGKTYVVNKDGTYVFAGQPSTIHGI